MIHFLLGAFQYNYAVVLSPIEIQYVLWLTINWTNLTETDFGQWLVLLQQIRLHFSKTKILDNRFYRVDRMPRPTSMGRLCKK